MADESTSMEEICFNEGLDTNFVETEFPCGGTSADTYYLKEIKTPSEMKDYILRSLGLGVVCVEVTDEQIYDAMNEAVAIFQRYALFEGKFEDYLPFILRDGQRRYEIPRVYGIAQVVEFRTTENPGDINKLFSNTHLVLYEDIMYGNFWGNRLGRGGGDGGRNVMSNFNSAMQYLKDINRLLGKTYNCEWRPLARELIVTPTPHGDVRGVIRVYRNENVENVFNNVLFKRLAVAMVGIRWARNLLKFSAISLPGGGNISADSLLSTYQDQYDKTLESIIEEGKFGVFLIG